MIENYKYNKFSVAFQIGGDSVLMSVSDDKNEKMVPLGLWKSDIKGIVNKLDQIDFSGMTFELFYNVVAGAAMFTIKEGG